MLKIKTVDRLRRMYFDEGVHSNGDFSKNENLSNHHLQVSQNDRFQ